MSKLQDAIVSVALSQVGIREAQANNTGPDIVKYQKATTLPPGPWPWCSAFVSWVLASASELVEVKIPIYTGALAYGWEKHARDHGWEIFGEQAATLPGDIITFDFSHVGIVTAASAQELKFIQTVEGNTNGKGERDSETGDGVWSKTRARSLAKSIIRIKV